MFSLRVPTCGAVLLAMVFLGSPRAQAQSDDSGDSQRYRSAKNWAMELHLGPYRPDVDSEFGQLPPEDRPHHRYFGSKRRLLFRAGLDYQIFKAFGSLAVGVSVGYTKEKAKAFVARAQGTRDVPSGDSTELMMIPTTLSLVYRFDVLALRWKVPVVPYARAGLDWVYWSISNGDGAVAKHGSDGRGRGGTTGFHGAVGLALVLDALDPGSAQKFDAETGINHTYLFGELRHAQINGLGVSNRLHVGDTTWSAGLLFEF